MLARWDSPARFESVTVDSADIKTNPYVVVRWIDRWGQEWVSQAGITDKVPDGTDWLHTPLPSGAQLRSFLDDFPAQ